LREAGAQLPLRRCALSLRPTAGPSSSKTSSSGHIGAVDSASAMVKACAPFRRHHG
jgi:hypothetical protein